MANKLGKILGETFEKVEPTCIYKKESVRVLEMANALYNGQVPTGYVEAGCYTCDGTDELCPRYMGIK